MIIVFGSSLRRLLLVLALATAFIVQAGTIPLTVNLSFQRTDPGAAAVDEANVAGDAWIFVLDHSGSMGNRITGTKQTLWEALLVSLEETLGQAPPGSVIQIVKVGETEKTRYGKIRTVGAVLTTGRGVPVRNATDVKPIIDKVQGWGPPNGGTPLYHGLYLACQEAQRFLRTENRSVSIIVFTDGKDQDHTNNIRKKEDLSPFKGLFDEPSFNALLLKIGEISAGLSDGLDNPFGSRFSWKSPSKNIVMPVVCPVRSHPMVTSLKNPFSTGGRASVSTAYRFSLTQKRWDNILAEGIDADICLRTSAGEVIGGDVIHIAKGATSANIVFRVPDHFFTKGKAVSFDLTLSLPPDDIQSCRFVPPAPVRLSFEEQGSVTLSAVKPDSGNVYKVDEPVSFSVSGTEGASYTWIFGTVTNFGARVTHPFSTPAPKGVSFTVLAEKAGLAPATYSGTLVIVKAGVKLDPLPAGLKVGDTAVFSCRGEGEVTSYDWFVDGAPSIGEDAKDGGSSRISVPLEKVGEHTIRVRANMKRVSPAETPDIAFSVAPAPFAAIVKPEPNERFSAETVIPLEASVEGGFASGVWTVCDDSGAPVGSPILAPVIDKVARGNFPAPEAGGDFRVSFVAGEGTNTVSAASIPFSAKAKNILLDIVSPVKDSYVRTDSPSPLKVVSVGISGSVEFFLVDEASGEENKLAEAKIAADGSASVSHIFPSSKGQGERMLVAKTADGKLISDPVPFVLETEADLILKSPANNAHVEYGGELDFEAEPSGAIKAKEVQWFLRPVGGVEEKIKDGTGTKYAHTFAAMPNRKSLTYEVYARAPLPDRTEIETDHVFVRALCPAIQAFIVQPQVNGVVLASIGKQVDYTVSLKLAEGEDVSDVVWDMDDGAAYTNLTSVKHAYRDYGTYEIKASGQCAKCGEAFSVKAPSRVVVEKQSISASFAIRASATSPKTISGMIAQGRQITLTGQTSADISKREWTCNGQIILGDDGKPKQGPSIEYRCKDVGEYVFGLTVYDDAGSSVGPEKHAVRTYRLWAILLIAFVCLMIWGMLVWYWKGDDPRFWTIFVRLDRNRNTSFNDLKESQKRPLKISVGDYWNTAGNVATIPMRKLTRNLRDAGNWKKTGLGDSEITISAISKNDKPIAVIQKLHGGFTVTVEDKADPGVFRLVSDTPEDPPVVLEIKQNIGDKTHVLYMVLSFVGLSLAATGLTVWLAF